MVKLAVYPKQLNTRQAERLIASIAKDSECVVFSEHALERMEEVNLTAGCYKNSTFRILRWAAST